MDPNGCRRDATSRGIFRPTGHNSCMPERSTAILKLARKSASMIGKATSVWRNFQLNTQQ